MGQRKKKTNFLSPAGERKKPETGFFGLSYNERMKWPRKIIHIDMDAFFAAVEQRDNPELRGKPIAVGGSPSGRGVLSTASYEARKFGLRSAMPAAQAKKMCPQAIFVRPNFEKYKAVSIQVMGILRQHTPLVEPVSIDEAYLNVTENKFGIEDPGVLASLIKQNIQAVTKLTASAGVATSLFLAKMASDYKKPDGLTVVLPGKEKEFLRNQPVRKIPGIGPKGEEILKRMKIQTCGELAEIEQAVLVQKFGKWGHDLYEKAQGRGDREVIPDWEPKQYSSEETFAYDITDKEILKSKLRGLAEEVIDGLARRGKQGKTAVLKVKYFDFESITRSFTAKTAITDIEDLYTLACDLLDRKTDAGKKAVRLIGLGISGLDDPGVFAVKERDLFSSL